MTGAYDWVVASQPYMGEVRTAIVAGRTAVWRFATVDASGVPVDWTGWTGVCQVFTDDGETVLATPTVALTVGLMTVTLTAANSGALEDGPRRRCSWGLELSDGTQQVQGWHADHSPFIVFPDRG